MSWKGVLTNVGVSLLSQWAEGNHLLNITKATIGSGTKSAADMLTATALTTPKTDAMIAAKEKMDNGVKIRVRMGPSPSAVGSFTGKEIGIWANLDGGANVLLSYHTDDDTGISIPSETSSPEFAFDLICPLILSNDGELNIDIDPSIFATYTTIQEMIEVIPVSFGTISSFPKTVNNADITSDMVPIRWEFGTPDAMTQEPTVTISTGSITINGALDSGKTTTAIVYLSKSTNAFGLMKGDKGNKGDKGDPGDAYIDDDAGRGETSKVWSADKVIREFAKENLIDEVVPDTTQEPVFDSHGDILRILHKDGNDVTVRTDEFTFGADTIVETRTLSTGETLTITTNTDTLETTIVYTTS